MKDIKEVIEAFNQIQATTKKNEKMRIIEHYKQNDLFKSCLQFLLDGKVVTGLSKKKINKVVSLSVTNTFNNTFEDCMNYLKQNNTGSDADIVRVQDFISNQDKEDRDFYTGMVTKSIKLGCDYKTVNKVIPGLIETWEVQLGSGFDKLKLKKDELIFVSQKMNGNRGSYFQGKFISRQGKDFTGLQHICNEIHSLELDDWFLDGELIRKNVDGVSDNENFTIGTGILNSDAPTKEEIKFVVFDMFPASEIPKKVSKETYKKRYEWMQQLSNKINELNLKHIEVVTFVYVGTDHSVLSELLDNAVKNGWEGNMIAKDAKYECKRTTNLIKQKRFYSFDLPIVDILEGDGKLKGTMGSVMVKFKNNTVNVGSGFDDETREYFWNHKDKLIGRIIEVKYKEISKDKKTGLESLQFPIFLGLRELGKEESYN